MEDKFVLRGPVPKEPLYPRSVGIRLFHTLKEHARSEKTAFIDIATNKSLSYKELFEVTVKVAINLNKLGYAGKIIGVCSENRNEFFIPVVAALYLGSPVVTMNHGYTPRELLHACEVTKPSFLFCTRNTYSSFKKLKETEPMNYLQQIWTIENIPKLCSGVTQLDKFQPLDVHPKEQIAALLFSSGTTGLPKAVAVTHTNLSFVHRSFFNDEHILSKGDNSILCLPFYHGYGFNVGLAYLLKGIPVKFLEKFDAAVFLGAIEKYKVNYLNLVPPLMMFLAKHPLVDKYDVSSLKIVTCGAASCSRELETAVLNRLHQVPSIYQGYGLTEATFSVISMPTYLKPKQGSIGIVDPGLEMKIRDPENNISLGVNQVGEVCIRGDIVMKEYYGNPEATKATISADKWLYTGDMGYYDSDGCVFIVDRLKELIKFKGFQVPPAELEGLLISHPKVLDAAVIGYPDDVAGELPLAFIVKKPGVEVNAQEIKDFIKGQVSYPKQLHGGVKFVDEIPKSRAGKILRRELRELLKAEGQKSKL